MHSRVLLTGCAMIAAAVVAVAWWPPVSEAEAQAKAAAKKKDAAKAAPKKKKRRAKPPPEPAFDQNPYRVQVNVAFSGSTAMNARFRADVLEKVRTNVANGYGTMWKANYNVDTRLSPPSRLGLQQLTVDGLMKRYPLSNRTGLPGLDKVFFITLETNGPKLLVSGREWDVRSQKLSPVESKTIYRRDRAADAAYTLLTELFRPIFIVETVDGYTVNYLLRAASFPPVDPNLAQIQPGDVIVPYFRYADAEYRVQRIQFLPWTYTIVTNVQRQLITGDLISAFRSPLGSGKRRRVEMLGMRIRPRGKSSRLKMVYQTDETKALVGYNVTLVRKFHPRDVSTLPTVEQFSGRDGYVDVPVDPKNPVTWVYVYSGKALLARVPYVSGIVPQETIPLPDDSIRLAVEGDLAILMGDLIDTIARRATLMALCIMDFNDPKLVDKPDVKRKRINAKIDEMIRLTKQRQFLDRVAVIRGPRLAAAQRLGNRFAATRIKRMCDKAEELINAYLKQEVIDKFIEDIEQGKFEQKKTK